MNKRWAVQSFKVVVLLSGRGCLIGSFKMNGVRKNFIMMEETSKRQVNGINGAISTISHSLGLNQSYLEIVKFLDLIQRCIYWISFFYFI